MVVFKPKQKFINHQAESKKNQIHVKQAISENAFHNWRGIV